MLSNIRFIAELFIRRLVPEDRMVLILKTLLSHLKMLMKDEVAATDGTPDSERSEEGNPTVAASSLRKDAMLDMQRHTFDCLCELIATVGPCLIDSQGENIKDICDEMKPFDASLSKKSRWVDSFRKICKLLKKHQKVTPGVQVQESTKLDLPLRHGEVGILVSADKSSIPYLVRTPSGSTWWYERKAIVAVTGINSDKKVSPENGKSGASNFTIAERDRLVQCLAPLVMCAMRKLPLECETGRALISFDTQQAVAAVLSFLHTKTLKLRLDTVEILVEAEEIFREILAVDSSNVAPSLLPLLLDQRDLKELLDNSSLLDASQGVVEGHINLGSEGISELQVLDAVKGALLEVFATEVSADEIIDQLASAEDQVCEVYTASSFQALTSGMSFLRFCASSAKQIYPLLHFKSLACGSKGQLGGASDAVRLRLLEVVRLSMQPPDAERISPSHIQGVVERHFSIRLECLGYSSVNEIMEELGTQPPTDVILNKPIFSGQSLLLHGTPEETMSKEEKFRDALRELTMAPFLIDLSEWMDWGNRFFDALGPWPDFVRGVWIESGGSLGALLLEVQAGRHIKLPVSHSPHDFNDALRRHDALEAAAIAVSLAVDCGSVSALSASFQLLRAQVEGQLMAMSSAQAAGFVLAATVAVPPSLRPALAVPLFVDALLAKVPGAERALPAQCSSLADRVALRQVGLACGKLAWIIAARPHCSDDCSGGALAGSNAPLDLSDATVWAVNPAAESTVGGEDMRMSAEEDAVSAEKTKSAAEVAGTTPVLELAEDGIHPDTTRVCRRVRSSFGLEEGLAPPTPATLAVVNKSIERLAADLYAKEVHFILEVSYRCCCVCTLPCNVMKRLRVLVPGSGWLYLGGAGGC